ncbi:MAG TPA: hypothetical protein VF045_09220 [Acidimicrobiales bacterium]
MKGWRLWALVAAAIGTLVIGGSLVAGSGEDDAPGDDRKTSAAAATTSVPAPSQTTATVGAIPTTAPIDRVTTPPNGSVTTVTTPTTVAPATTVTAPARRVPDGTWGGQGIRLVVSPSGGTVEYDCAAGFISEALVLGGGESFQAAGTHSSQPGGPSQPGTPTPSGQPARYSGSLNGSQMTLTVVLPDTGLTLGPFSLGLGQAPLLDRCG